MPSCVATHVSDLSLSVHLWDTCSAPMLVVPAKGKVAAMSPHLGTGPGSQPPGRGLAGAGLGQSS